LLSIPTVVFMLQKQKPLRLFSFPGVKIICYDANLLFRSPGRLFCIIT